MRDGYNLTVRFLIGFRLRLVFHCARDRKGERAEMIENTDFERLAARVRTSARDGGLIETAQVKLLGLDEVRDAAGPRWPRMREHVREGSLKIIAARLGPQDAVIPCGDGFLVVFADAAGDDTQKRCGAMRDALVSFYLGEEALKALRADVNSETVSAAHLAGIVGAAPELRSHTEMRSNLKVGRFWPVWSAPRQRVSAYLCAPLIQGAPNRPLRMGYDGEFAEHAAHRSGVDFLDLDLCLLDQAFDAVDHIESAPIGVSVHVTTLQSRKARTHYLNHLASNASSAKQRMFISIAEIEPGTPLLSLTEWTIALRHTVPRIALELHRNDRAINAIASTGAWAAGYQVGPFRGVHGGQLRGALNEIDAWCRTLRRQGMQPFMHGFADTGVFDLASFTEIAFATGEALWPSQLTPEPLAARQHHFVQPAMSL